MTFWVGAVRMMAGYGHFLYTVDYFLYTVTPLRCTAARETNAHLLFQVPVLKRDLEQAV